MKQKVRSKLWWQAGESLIETLVALLIAVFALTMLPGAIVAAVRVNRQAEQQYVRANGNTAIIEATVNLTTGAAATDYMPVTVYCDTPGEDQTGDSYYYYYYGKTP